MPIDLINQAATMMKKEVFRKSICVEFTKP